MIITGSAHPRESSEIKVEVEEEKPKEEAEIGTQRGRGGECGSPNMRDPELPAEPGAVEPGRTLGAAAPGVRLDQTPGKRRSGEPRTPNPEAEHRMGPPD